MKRRSFLKLLGIAHAAAAAAKPTAQVFEHGISVMARGRKTTDVLTSGYDYLDTTPDIFRRAPEQVLKDIE